MKEVEYDTSLWNMPKYILESPRGQTTNTNTSNDKLSILSFLPPLLW
ncbi:hypothetical protein MTR67_039748 [Solanum verrucosum]|uniref:Uncharacterized protein n=1 Tax=Solanum verrucosum TaxID=315347 RepID=A0AAF0UJ36_SOLVR|nr:hypothetical protein MTR67_039748 [Solanum verrucosum]